jgi:hypothetical protein
MSIVLRTNKGSALTYDEMDRNQSQFFYSSSKSPDGLGLRLHYTGSDNLDTDDDYGPTRYHEIAFPVFESEVPDSNVAGDNTQIQFNNNNNFGAKSTFVFTKNNTSVGIGLTAPEDRLSIAGDGDRSATISLSGNSTTDSVTNKANIKFFNTGFSATALIGQIGKLQHKNFSNIDDVFIHAGNENYNSANKGQQRRVHIAIGDVGSDSLTTLTERIGVTFLRTHKAPAMVGINTTDPSNNLEVVGTYGIGLVKVGSPSKTVIKPGIDGNLASVTDSNGIRRLFPVGSTTNGLQITTPPDASGGSILMVINTGDDEQEGFNIITSRATAANDTAELIASFQIRDEKGAVGIGTNLPAHKGLTIQEKLSIKSSTESNPFEELTRTLVADSTGLVKEVVAAPVPKGGIIMWSGAIDDIPKGWRLCKNGVGTVNGVTVPNLSNKFIIASSNATGTPTTTILGTGATSTGGSTSFQPTGGVTINKLTHEEIPPHHHFFLGDDRLYNRIPAGTLPGLNSIERVGGPGIYSTDSNTGIGFREVLGYDAASSNSSNEDRRLYATSHNNAFDDNTSTSVMTIGGTNAPVGTFTGDTAEKAIIPPFYALAYIIYVGLE